MQLLDGGASLVLLALFAMAFLVIRGRGVALAAKDGDIEALQDELWELKEAAAARGRAEAANEAKSRFLATVSHEIRTPLSGILGLADLLAEGSLSGEQRSYVEAIRTSGTSLAALIDEILDFSKIEAGKVDLAVEPVDLALLVEGIVELLAPRAHGKGLEIAARVEADVPRTIWGDETRLRQVLMNLVGNAVKFTDRGGVGVHVRVNEDGAIVCAVSDTGIGIAKDKQEAIFGEFEQADGSAARRHGGTGLGLAISQNLIELMGGRIHVRSEEGHGSVFAFTLAVQPVKTADGPQPSTPPGQRVLIVSGSVFEAPYMAASLREASAHVEIASDMGDALTRLKTGPAPDIVIIDCALGPALIAPIASAARGAGVVRKLIVFSPFERRTFGDASMRDFDNWLVKPVRARSLLAQVQGLVQGHDGPEQPTSRARDVEKAETRNLRVLLAEDEDVNAMIALSILKRLGTRAVRVKDGAAALSHAEEAIGGLREPFDAIVMDVRMPGLDGREVARRLRRAEARAGAPPTRLIALTANAQAEDRRACLDAGFDVFLTKPLDILQLTAALKPSNAAMGDAGASAAAH